MAMFARPQKFGTFSRKLQLDMYLPMGLEVGVWREQGSGQGCTGSQKEDVLHPNLTPLEQKPVASVYSTHPGVSVGKTHPFDENHGISHREGPGTSRCLGWHRRNPTTADRHAGLGCTPGFTWVGAAAAVHPVICGNSPHPKMLFHQSRFPTQPSCRRAGR